ncbi:TldD/PmbA family protein [Christensenellaceae bacterium OttesenSCG-928-L17]|nr:TldD/PmbA family protein [Christensenellaceae bacterium OttesenSCG-928-L17]
MEYRAFRDQLFLLANKMRVEAELYYATGEAFSAGALDGALDSYRCCKTAGLGLRVYTGGKTGYAYTEELSAPQAFLAHAIDNAAATGQNDPHPMQHPADYPACPAQAYPILTMSNREKIDLALAMEAAAKTLDKRVCRVKRCAVSTSVSEITIDNTHGLHAFHAQAGGSCVLAPVLEQNSQTQSEYAFRVNQTAHMIDACAQEAVQKTAARFGGEAAPTGEYRVLLHAEAAGDLLAAFSPMFSADMAQKVLSPLRGMENEIIAAACISLVDDPLHPDFSRPFDGEGTPARKNRIVHNGQFLTLLHNLKTAQKANTASTGNAARTASSPIGVAPGNFFILPGNASFDTLLTNLSDGLLITDISGLHAGAHPVNGRFSLIAKGFFVKNGIVGKPVERITVAGSFLELLRDTEMVGSDLLFGLPGMSRIGSPSLLVPKLMVAGR